MANTTTQRALNPAPGTESGEHPPQDNKGAPAEGTLRWFLESDASSYRARLNSMLGKRAPQFIASLLSLASSSKKFEDVKPRSIIASAAIAATLDLPIDRNLGFAWIIPYGKLAQFQIGYRGWIQLALRSGQYAGMNVAMINAEAFQSFNIIGDPIIRWDLLDETKPAIGYAFGWQLKTGFTKIVYWSTAKVEAHARRYSKAYRYGLDNPGVKGAKDSPWFTHYNEMGMKTVLTTSLKRWGIMSVEYQEMQFAYERDQSAAIDVDARPIYPDNDEDLDDAGETTKETIRQPKAKELSAQKEAAGMTAESVRTGGKKTRDRKGEKLRREAKQQAPANDVRQSDVVPDASGAERRNDDTPWRKAQDNPQSIREDVVVDDALASPNSVKMIRVKLERAELTIDDLRASVSGLEKLESLETLKAGHVNKVLQWISKNQGATDDV